MACSLEQAILFCLPLEFPVLLAIFFQMRDEDPVLAEILAEVQAVALGEVEAYLTGAVRDGTFNRLHSTTRISQGDERWLRVLKVLLQRVGKRGWIYREGRRSVWTIETTWRPDEAMDGRDLSEQIAFARGYFDAEGGIPAEWSSRFYIQLVQKDRRDLDRLRMMLQGAGIHTGRLHNPSWRSDPDYWRFYVLARSYECFVRRVGSWHPRKRTRLLRRFHQR